MALPSIIMPSALGTWLLADYGIAQDSLYARAPMSAGADRKRRLYTVAPRRDTAALLLSREQATLFNTWFEDGLQAGARQFSAPMAKLGGGLAWWAARFVEPPQWEPLHLGRWRLRAQLLLTDGPQTSAPTPSSLAVRPVARLQGRAQAAATLSLELFVSVQLEGEVG